jgi:GNAT superfamily N-acetyltransferase
VEIVELDRLSGEQRAQLEGSESDPFDAASERLVYRPKQRHVALRDEDGQLLAAAGLVPAELEVGALRMPIVGLGGVIVNEHHRGRGYARVVVEAAVIRAAATERAFIVLFCLADRAGLYRGLAFTDVAAPVEVLQPEGFVVMRHHTMYRALRERARWPGGVVRLLGLPF